MTKKLQKSDTTNVEQKIQAQPTRCEKITSNFTTPGGCKKFFFLFLNL